MSLRIDQEIMKYETDIVHHIQALIQIRSVQEEAAPGQPYGAGIDRALRYMLDLGRSLGFTAEHVDGYAGHVEYGSGEELAAVLVHLDTVPEGSGWTYPPLGGEIADGRIYGRGAADDKGPAVVALYALRALADSGIVPNRRLRIIFGTDEENGMRDMDAYFQRQPVPDYAFTPDAGYPITNAEKGYYVVKLRAPSVGQADRQKNGIISNLRMHGGSAPNVVPDQCEATFEGPVDRVVGSKTGQWLIEDRVQVQQVNGETITLQGYGRSAHGAYPPGGINAISWVIEALAAYDDQRTNWAHAYPLLHFLHRYVGFEAFGESLGIAHQDEIYGRTTVNLAQVTIDEQLQEAVFNVRHPVTTNGETLIETFRKLAVNCGLELSVLAHLEPLYVPADSPLITMLSRAYEAITGEKARLLSIGGGTYARKLRNRGVAFGAGMNGTNTRPHQPDEFVIIDEMMAHGRICTQALAEMALWPVGRQ